MTSQPDLFDATTRHSIYLSRYASGVVNRMLALVNRAEPDLVAQIAAALERMPPESFTVERLELLLASFRTLNASLYGEVLDAVKAEVREFSAYETGFQARMLNATAAHAGIEVSFASASAEAVYAAALSRPFQGVLLREALAGVEAATAKRVRDAIRMGYVEGEPIAKIVQRIKGTRAAKYADGLLDWPRRDVASVVRTAVAHTANVARQETYEANDDIVKEWLFVATLDNKTSLTCASLNGKRFKVGAGPMPPRHYNCLSGDSLVLPRSGITGAYERWFDGEVIVIKTASGRELTSTPNHPILTGQGWVASGALNVGDNVVCDGGSEWRGIADGNHQDMPSSIEHVTRAFFASSEMIPVPVPLSAEDFHGDGAGSKIAVVATDSLLRNGFDSLVKEHPRECGFIDGYAPADAALARGRGLFEGLIANRAASGGFVGCRREALSLLRAGVVHSCKLLLRSVAGIYAILFEHIPNPSKREPGALIYASDAYAGAEHGDHVVFGGGSIGDSVVADESHDCGLSQTARRVQAAFGNKPSDDFVGDTVGCREFSGSDASVESIDDGSAIELTSHSTDGDAVALEQFCDGVDADAMLASYILSGSSGEVFLDDVVSIKRVDYSGHVYNLETVDGWYCANGILTHNCRSAAIPILVGQENLYGTRASVDYRGERPKGRQVDANMSFSTWLRGQGAEVQNEVLGAERGKLFRSNKIEVDRFTDAKGRVYTLEELRRRDAALFGEGRKAA